MDRASTLRLDRPAPSQGHVRPASSGRPYRLAVAMALGVALVLTGGASRYDETQQMLARLAAITAIAASLWPLDIAVLRRRWGWLGGAGAIYGLLLAQLCPLPPALWASLPGHGLYAQVATQVGAAGWRPLSLTPDLTVNALFALLPATAMALCALHLASRSRLRLAEGVVLAALASGLLGLLQLATGGGLHLFRESSADSAVGLFANRNHQAVLEACALPLLGAVAGVRVRESHGRIAIPAALIAAAFMLASILLTGSRMGLLLGAVGLAGAAWSYRASGHRLLPRRWPARAALAGLTCVTLAALVLAAAHSGVIQRLQPDGVTGDTRAAMLQPLLSMARAFMPWGGGFGAFDAVYRHFEPGALLSTIYMNQAHDEPLQLAIEGGAPALALQALFGLWWAVTALRCVRGEASGRRRAMGGAAMVVTVILMLSSLVDYPLRTPLLSALFALACVEIALSAEKAVAPDPWRSKSQDPPVDAEIAA